VTEKIGYLTAEYIESPTVWWGDDARVAVVACFLSLPEMIERLFNAAGLVWVEDVKFVFFLLNSQLESLKFELNSNFVYVPVGY